jgi:hypothetical protein
MSKRCAKCEYKLEDICRFWQCWRKNAPLNYCSQKVINRAKEAGYIQYHAGGLGGGTKVLDKYGLLEIVRDEFKLLDLVIR